MAAQQTKETVKGGDMSLSSTAAGTRRGQYPLLDCPDCHVPLIRIQSKQEQSINEWFVKCPNNIKGDSTTCGWIRSEEQYEAWFRKQGNRLQMLVQVPLDSVDGDGTGDLKEQLDEMDRASILGDAVEYLKELLQSIRDLHNELESAPSSSLVGPTSASFNPSTPTLQTFPGQVKEELCPGSFPSPTGQQATVEVGMREGHAVNIHMFCAHRPGIVLSTMTALNNLGLNIEQAVISCYDGFAMDVFRAEGADGQEMVPEEIKAMLMRTAGLDNAM